MTISVIGGGLTGCVLASRLKDCVIYEREAIGGLCWEVPYYQLFPHIFHTDDGAVLEWVLKYTTIRPYTHFVSSYAQGKYILFPPEEIDQKVFDERIANYSFKIWKSPAPLGAIGRIKPARGMYFKNKYQGILDMNTLFRNLTKDIEIKRADIRDGDLKEGKIILTGAIDEYFNYRYGRLPYRGMKVIHLQSETRLATPVVNFPDLDLPFIRMTDYNQLGFEGNWIGIEFPSSEEKYYPVDTPESKKLYKKYERLAKRKGILLAGRLATYQYQNMDSCVKQALDLEIK